MFPIRTEAGIIYLPIIRQLRWAWNAMTCFRVADTHSLGCYGSKGAFIQREDHMLHKSIVVLCSEYYHWPLTRFPWVIARVLGILGQNFLATWDCSGAKGSLINDASSWSQLRDWPANIRCITEKWPRDIPSMIMPFSESNMPYKHNLPGSWTEQ